MPAGEQTRNHALRSQPASKPGIMVCKMSCKAEPCTTELTLATAPPGHPGHRIQSWRAMGFIRRLMPLIEGLRAAGILPAEPAPLPAGAVAVPLPATAGQVVAAGVAVPLPATAGQVVAAGVLSKPAAGPPADDPPSQLAGCSVLVKDLPAEAAQSCTICQTLCTNTFCCERPFVIHMTDRPAVAPKH